MSIKLAAVLGIGAAVILALLLASNLAQVRSLKQEVERTRAERDSAQAESKALEALLAELARERDEDRAVLAEVWSLLQKARPQASASGMAENTVPIDLSAVRAMVDEHQGDLGAVVREIMTTLRLGSTLEKHAGDPAIWVAAASMCTDIGERTKYLETAAAQFPGSPIAQTALIEAKQVQPEPDPTTWMAIDSLRQADPTSSLADHYEAYYRFKGGDPEGGLQALAAASEKGRLADSRMELMMGRYDTLLENGCSDDAAWALAAFTLPFDHLPMIRETSQQALDQAQTIFAAGQPELALQTAEYIARIGRNLSSSGRFIVYDRVGIQLQRQALETQRRFHEAVGNRYQVSEIDFQLGAVRAREAQINEMVNAFGPVMAAMTPEAVVQYIDSTVMHGEFTTLRGLTAQP